MFNKSFVIILTFITIGIELVNTRETLRLVQIVQRHGDRTPTNFYPNDPYKDESYWTDGIGELTRSGKRRMFAFGKYLSTKYDNYLGGSPRGISVRSTSTSRTLESAQCFTTGLCKPSGYWVWSNDSLIDNITFANYWQPIAVYTIPGETDSLLRTTAKCPKADQLWREFMKSEPVTTYLSDKKQFIQYLSSKTGDEYWSVEPSPLRPLEFLSTTLRIERENGLQMPEWADEQTLLKLRDLEKHAFYYDWNSKQIQRLRTGLLLQELYNNMFGIMNGNLSKTNTKKLYLYEAHDVNQVVLMQALNLYNQVKQTPPTYAASIVFELHQIQDQFVVKVIYYNNVTIDDTLANDYLELKLENCVQNTDSHCTLEEFQKSILDFIPNDWAKECMINNSISSKSLKFPFIYLFIWILFGFVTLQ